MAPTRIALHQAFQDIINQAGQSLEAQRADGALLADVNAVVVGDRGRWRPSMPYVWVTVGAAEATHARSLHENWSVALMLNALVQAEDPHDGWMGGFGLAARARSVVIADRTLSLPYVEDVQSAQLSPLGNFNGRSFAAFARLDVRLTLVEPSL